ncbi:hypothetical protein CTA2_6250 [Colletotrichum tanaceti]|uniref:Uncharacterized protein n=1 Tax=Colletotrichum tanaceti TaxID=1306861 RepID=A0A4U6X1I1_9PEZI|nr:hypothetical protein CTA2_6250 [Colletotrichum tanaceti]TKW49232.1 hypothetical protein CTA1_586 [Colletotrichum tanaceti]
MDVFTLDVRHPEDAVVDEVQRRCLESFGRIAGEDGRGVEMRWTLYTDSPAVEFDGECIRAVEQAADGLVGPDGWDAADERRRARQRLHEQAVPDRDDLRALQGRREPPPGGVLQPGGLRYWYPSPARSCHRVRSTESKPEPKMS